MYHTVRTTPPASYSLLHQPFVSSHSHSLLIPSIILFLLFIPYYTIIRNQSPPRPPDLLAAVNSTALLVFVSCGSRSLLDFVLYSTGYSLSLSLSLSLSTSTSTSTSTSSTGPRPFAIMQSTQPGRFPFLQPLCTDHRSLSSQNLLPGVRLSQILWRRILQPTTTSSR